MVGKRETASKMGKIDVEEFHVMEKRLHRETFVQLAESDTSVVHELVFAIQQLNLEKLEAMVMERSTPGSDLYRQWMSYDEVGSLVANPVGYEAVRSWLVENNVNVKWTSPRSEYIKAKAPIHVWNRMLNTKFYQFQDTEIPAKTAADRLAHRVNYYSLPKIVRPHLMAVFNTVQNPPVLNPRVYEKAEHKSSFRTDMQIHKVKSDGSLEHLSNKQLQGNGKVTVAFLNEYYQISSNTGNASQSQAVFETNSESFSQSDLTQFQNSNNLPLQAALAPFGFNTSTCTNNCYEGNLDVQYIMGVAQQTATIYWYVDPTAQNNVFLEWIQQVTADPNPPLVNSISWGAVEQACSASDLNQFSTEALKLVAIGVSIVVSTGDNGSAGAANRCNVDSGSSNADWTGGTTWSGRGYFPSFPASSPYVTAVGATMGAESGNTDIACQSNEGGIITTGGGFSTFYPTPSWQQPAVDAYFAGLTSQPSPGYNPNGRGYPDISFTGVNYQTVIQTAVVGLYGTSASAPLFGAMLSLLNAARVASNLTSVGFINPTLYAYGMPNTFGLNGTNFNPFNDVTSGHTECMAQDSNGNVACCESGFEAAAGWDPVTGWGSTYYPNLAQMLAVEANYTAPASNGNGNGGLSEGATIAIVVVVIVAVILFIVGVVYYCCCGNRASRPARNPQPVQAFAVVHEPPPVEYQMHAASAPAHRPNASY